MIVQILQHQAFARPHREAQAPGRGIRQQGAENLPADRVRAARQLAGDHLLIGGGVGQQRLGNHLFALQQLHHAALHHHGGTVADLQQLLKMKTYVQEGDTLCCVVAEDGVQLAKLGFIDEGADLIEHDQPAAGHYSLEQLHHKALEYGKVLHARVRVDGDADAADKRRQLPPESDRAHQPPAKPGTKHKDIVRDAQPVHQTALGLNDADAVVVRLGGAPGVDQLFPVEYIAIVQGQVFTQQITQSGQAVGVDGHQPQDLALEDMQVQVVQLGYAPLSEGYLFQSKHFVSHTSASRLGMSRSLAIMGRVISTSVPTPGVEKACRPYLSPKSRRMRLSTLASASPPRL